MFKHVAIVQRAQKAIAHYTLVTHRTLKLFQYAMYCIDDFFKSSTFTV